MYVDFRSQFGAVKMWFIVNKRMYNYFIIKDLSANDINMYIHYNNSEKWRTFATVIRAPFHSRYY